jgi:hypothetical protein
MSASNAAETALLTLMFNNTAWANIGDAVGLRGSTTAGVFYISLHTADPGETGTQTTSETAYTSYARVSVARSSAGFTISGNTVSNAAAVTFPIPTGSVGAVVTYLGIGTDSTGAGNLIMSGPLGASYQTSLTNAPNFAIGALTATAD